MHIDNAGRQYTTVDGQRRAYPCHLLRRSFRDEAGRPRKETLANLSALPPEAIDALRKVLKGATLVDAEVAFDTERSVPHGDVAAAHVMATRLGLRRLLGSVGRERDIAYALILSRAVRPTSKLSTARWWSGGDTTLGADLGVADASTDEVYAAMDWLAGRQPDIEAQLARRHLRAGGIAMFDLSSSWVEGQRCELAAFGHSRDGKRGRPQIEYGLLTCPAGRPVAIEVFAGNTSDAMSFKTAVTRVRDDFGIEKIILVGDRGMITTTRIKELRECDGMDWITALRAPAIAALASDDGPLQPSLFDTCNLAEITHPNYPGERLICCRNPALAHERARKRQALLAATEKDLDKIAT
ncbi:MAG: IS1634 family transposase, partial [Stenotrophomonas sp.]